MKNLLTLLSISFFSICFGQQWQQIGSTLGANVVNQEMHIDPETGDLFVVYDNSVTDNVTVRHWNGTIWEVVGNAGFGPTTTNIQDLKITSIDGIPYVAIKYTSGVNTFIRSYWLNAGTWTTMGSTAYQTVASYDFSFKSSPNDGLYLCYYNQTSGAGSLNELIVIQVSATSQAQVAGDVNTDFYQNVDFITDQDELQWVACEIGDMSNYVLIHSENWPTYTNEGTILNDWSGKIVTNMPVNDDLRFASYVDDTYLGSRRYNTASVTAGTLYTIFSGTIGDYDMASDGTYDYFFYSSLANHYAERIDGSGNQVSLGTNFGFGSGTMSDLRIETWNGRVVVSYVRSGQAYILEIDNECTLTLGNTFGGCEQTLTTAPSVTVTVDDNNYSQADFEIYAYSTDIGSIPNTNVALVGNFPNYYLQFTSNDLIADVNVEFEIETFENGFSTNLEIFNADVVIIPSINISLNDDEVCLNHGPISLSSSATPSGGFWTGPGVNTTTNKFHPLVAGVGTHVLNYTYNNIYGCSNDDNVTITVNPVPSITVSTTSATCNEENGTVNATITGGTPGYTIYWSNGSDNEDIADLAPGIYYINVTDSKGCESVKPANVASTGLDIASNVVDVTCPGGNNGSVDITATSVSGVQSIEWSNGMTTEDISGVEAGTYEVTVTANDGCETVTTVTVNEPDALSFSAAISPATCGVDDGSASLLVNGGTAPYSYQWFETSTGAPIGSDNPALTNVFAGAYFAIITDDNGCVAVNNLTISEIGAPEVLFASVTPAGCSDDGAIDISINTDVPVASISWDNGATTEDITNLAPGFYSVEVTDQTGCVGTGGIEVPAASPNINPICLVTVDTSTNTNLLVWEKEVATDIDYYNIYRETSVAGEFLFIASVPYSDESVYNDLVASPQVRSWRYKIGAVNLCGEESDLSDFHKTIHLTINIGLGGLINLNWDEYEGFTFPTYDLYRHTNSSGWILLQSMPSTLFSYADTPPSMDGLDYIISVSPPDTCSSTEGKVQDHNSSRSNKSSSITGDLVGIDETDASGMTQIFPNPSNGSFNLYVTGSESNTYEATVTDIQGRVVAQFSSQSELSIIDLTAFSDGVYNIQILVDGLVINRKLVKQ